MPQRDPGVHLEDIEYCAAAALRLVELLLQKLAEGETIEPILQAHPRLTRPAILAAIDFGAQALRALSRP